MCKKADSETTVAGNDHTNGSSVGQTGGSSPLEENMPRAEDTSGHMVPQNEYRTSF